MKAGTVGEGKSRLMSDGEGTAGAFRLFHPPAYLEQASTLVGCQGSVA